MQAVHKRAHVMLAWCEQNGADLGVLQAAEAIMATVAADSPYREAYMFRNLVRAIAVVALCPLCPPASQSL